MRKKYPWNEWFAQPRTILLRGVDYDCSQSTMAQTVRNNASSRGLSVRITDTGTEIIVDVAKETTDAHTDTTEASVSGEHPPALAGNGAPQEKTTAGNASAPSREATTGPAPSGHPNTHRTVQA